MTNNRTDLMRASRESSSSAYMTFVQFRKYHAQYVFCFYEGEDEKYYNLRIKQNLNAESVGIIAGNKKNVIAVMQKLTAEEAYNNVKKMFFIDRDMDDMSAYFHDDLYITSCYSIENFYTSKEAFGRMIKTEFSVNILDNDYKKIVAEYERQYDNFCKIMIDFNALVYYRAEKNINKSVVNLDYRLPAFVKLDILVDVEKSHKYEETIQELKTALDISEEEFENAKQKISNPWRPNDIFRGKNQLDFMVAFITQLKDKKNEMFNSPPKRVYINITNNRLSELSQYADTPNELVEFIKKHEIDGGGDPGTKIKQYAFANG